MEAAAALRALALEAGFDDAGVARAEPIPPEVLTSWLEAGHHADMDWMAERVAERLDVTRLLPGARSVLALVSAYHHGDAPGPVARYARGRDYHATQRDRLRHLRRLLSARHPGVRFYGSADAAPVMEKVWAARAGLGFVGKNGCFITPRYGSWVVLAALVLTLEVAEETPGPPGERCGRCTLCIDACPTGAILPGAVVDARACLSYQTIENGQPVPEALRPALAGMAFGCDVCQDVCPLNATPLAGSARFAPRPLAALSLEALAGMSPEEYQAWMPGTALVRAGYHLLRRNAAYALGAQRQSQARPLLERLARDESPAVREAATWALQQLA